MAKDFTDEQEIVSTFQKLLEDRNSLSTVAIERRSDVAEHDLVIKTLEGVDDGRKCFRLIGEVMVQRSKGEVLPEVVKNRENLASVRRRMVFCRVRCVRGVEASGKMTALPANACWCTESNWDVGNTHLPPVRRCHMQLVKTYEEQLQEKQKEVLAFQKKYNIRIKVRT